MPLLAQIASAQPSTTWPFVVLLVCLGTIIVLITKVRLHPFLSLMAAAILAGVLAEKLPGEYGTLPKEPAKERSHVIQAVELTTVEFGTTAGKIALIIVAAAVIGVCLMESGAAERVVRSFLALFGEKRAGGAMVTSSYVMSIPIFFDTFFMLLLPIAKALRLRVGRDYMLYIMAICCAGIVTHSLMVPHPGPLAMAEALKVDLGVTIIAGFLIGIPPVFVSWWVMKWIGRRMDIPLREMPGVSLEEMKATAMKPMSELPSLTWSLLPVILPIFFISLASTVLAVDGFKAGWPVMFEWIQFLGNRNVALIIGTILAVILYKRQLRIGMSELMGRMSSPLETAGMIILITSAGGAFGAMLRTAGVGEAIQALVAGRNVNLIFLCWLVATVIRVAQGSATVAMLTTAGMMAPLLVGAPLPYHPVYIFLAIGFGAMMMSWMNDSGFWVVCKLSGFTERETLKTWTVMATVNGVTGLIVTYIASILVPLK